MTEDKAKKAQQYMAERKSNCSQSVFRVFSGDYGMDENTALKVSQGFGGGMGYSGSVCGAVSGACMALGLSNPLSKDNPRQSVEKTYAMMNEFTRKFKELHGTVNCCELLGYDLTNPEQLAEARGKGVFTSRCPELVADAVNIAEDLLK